MSKIVSTILVGIEPKDWREAVKMVCGSLFDRDAITATYIDRCIEMVEEHGPYIVIAPGIALVHARPEDGVLKLCLSVATLHNPVPFDHPENDPVDLLFAFGSPDRKQHIKLLSVLADALSNDLAEKLRQTRTEQEAQSIMNDLLEEVAQ